MSSLIVIRITPQTPVPATNAQVSFDQYLNPPSPLGPLTITAFSLSYDSVNDTPLPGDLIGSATALPLPSVTWSADSNGNMSSSTPPAYPSGITHGIYQQVDFDPATFVPPSPAEYVLKSVATAIIEVPSPLVFENLRIVAQWGSQSIPITMDFYIVALATGPTPDLSTWFPSTEQPDPWGQLAPPSLYLSLPAPSTLTNAVNVQLPSDGTPPSFDSLLAAVQQVLTQDPDGKTTLTPTGGGSPGGTTLQFTATNEIVVGMSISGTGIANGTTVVAVSTSGGVTTVTLSQALATTVTTPVTITPFTSATPTSGGSAGGTTLQFSATTAIAVGMWAVAAGIQPGTTVIAVSTTGGTTTVTLSQPLTATVTTAVTFTPNLGVLTFDECQNIAYEIVWSQQPPLPTPPDPIEDLYTNPPNSGQLMNGTSPNQKEGDRQQFQATLTSYYAQPNATANRLTNFIFSLSAAIACEQQSLAANQVLLEFPVLWQTPITPTTIAESVEAEVILTGVGAAPNNDFGVPAAYFYALAASMPTSMLASQRYTLATKENLPQMLADLTSALNAGTVTDSEAFVTSAIPPMNAAQAARRLAALNVPLGSTLPTLPLDSTLQPLVTDWLAFASTDASPSSQTYQPSDDAQLFWPNEVTTHVAAYLELVLCAVTDGYVIPAPTNASLASEIVTPAAWPAGPPAPPPAVTSIPGLAAITNAQWKAFFTAQPTWLPPAIAQQGNLAAQIANFIANLQTFFKVTDSSVASTIYYVTTVDAPSGSVLTFATTAGIVGGMSVTGKNIQPGTIVPLSGSPITVTTVTLSNAVTADVPAGTTIKFTSNYAAASTGTPTGLPLLQAPSTDWIGTCLSGYPGSSYVLGSGTTPLNLTSLQAAAANVFLNDPDAQAWLVNAINTLDVLCRIINTATPAIPSSIQFSVAEALYARGFTSAAEITELSTNDFREALTGSVAYQYATALYNSASNITAAPPAPTPGGSFQPVNPGTLTNCIPAPCRSPLGPIEYLHEMLQLSANATCSDPFASGTQTLSGAIATRRGPVGELAASCANLDTPLPLVDIVNECLEFMASATPATNGTVYNTSGDAAAGYALCKEGCQPEEKKHERCHDPEELLSALPEYSTPGTPAVSTDPLESNQNVEPLVYNVLKSDFSACCLPYSQALDVCRTYLRDFSTCRFEVMRTFRKCITEFVLAPENQPSGFENYLWRYPVRIDIAIEYLGITPEEYLLLFQGKWLQSCGPQNPNDPGPATGTLQPAQLYGFSTANTPTADDQSWIQTVVQLPEFLKRTCLTYCEFLDLWKCQPVPFSDGGSRDGKFPDCEPCCLEQHWLQFPAPPPPPPPPGPNQPPQNPPVAGVPVGTVPAPAPTPAPTPSAPTNEQSLGQLAVFIRLWRKLKDLCNAGYTFCQLHDICDVLELYVGGSLNPEFIRQLAAFQMLRDQFRLPLVNQADKPAAGAIDADRTQLLALWVGESAAQWPWAVRQLCEGIERHAKCRHKCDHRKSDFIKTLASNLDAISVLAGFDPTSSTESWQASPTHTLRFAEVVAKIYASRFHSDELFYLCTTGPHSEADRLFPPQGNDDAIEFPLNLPDDEQHHSLWKLRHKLLEVDISDDDVHPWTWNRIETTLREEFGYAAADLLAFGQHFFPGIVQSAGYQVTAQQRRYSSSLPAGQTTPGMWSTPATGPFQYDPTSGGALFIQLPLTDKAVIEQLEKLQQLNANEQNAVQDLYFQPRATLAEFAFLFADFAEAQQHLIQEPEAHDRWQYFQRQFALCHRRCKILAEHLAAHVDFATHQHHPEGVGEAFLVLGSLFGDENNPGNWENDSGTPPAVPWPGPNGGAFAALLGLIGTGLLREITPAGGSVIWRDTSGPLGGFGGEADRMNCPLPTVVPSLGLTLTPAQLKNVSILNGIAANGVSGAWLGGGQGFSVKWSGTLIVDHEGVHEFSAGAPTHEGERPDMERAEHCQWLVTLTRDGKTRTALNHNWPGFTGHTVPCPHLKAGAYDIVVQFSEPSPAFATKEEHRLHTGFQVKYLGPDSHGRLIEIPDSHLFRAYKNLQPMQTPNGGQTWEDLGFGITGLAPGAMTFLNGYYTSSLRDIRRTYQRAFKALLFAHRFPLSSKRRADGHSELGFMLSQLANFAGLAYYLSGGTYLPHAADFDFNFMPLVDNYYAPSATQDSRTQPSTQQSQAVFDWFERLIDYVHARDQVWEEHHCDLWALWDEAVRINPTNPGDLLRHMGARTSHWPLDLRFYQDQFNPPYSVTSTDLQDDRWTIRVWHADRLVRMILEGSSGKDAHLARPDLWASDDPSAIVDAQPVTGNANLSAFLFDRCFNYDHPRHYEEVRKLNDGLRDRGRRALICYLCAMDRVPLPWTTGQFAQCARDLSNVLLLDVEAGNCQKASRIEEAITAVQNFIRRARLGLEPSWPVTCDFAQVWDRHFATFHVWQACKRRELYKENYIEWEELEKAHRIEAFRSLETQLRRNALSVAEPGGLEWWPDQTPPAHAPIDLLQKIEPDETQLISAPHEGFDLLAVPERAGQPTWLTIVQAAASQPASSSSMPTSLPYWMESAIGMGRRFWRVAAAGVPPAGSCFKPHGDHEGKACCAECGCKHAPLVDEFYFWLVPGRYYVEPANPQQNGTSSGTNPDDYQYGFQEDFYSQSTQESGWQDPTQLPQMLLWNSSPLVRLGWCRYHNGEFQQPRVSSLGVPVVDNTVTDFSFVGRTADSLTFTVSNPQLPSPPPVLNDTSAPGFRFDLAGGCAVVLPQVVAPAPPAPGAFPGGLTSYPYFVYVTPGTHLLPLSFFSPALAVAGTLRTQCRFEAALKWYRLAFDLFSQDCTWIHCPQDIPSQPNPNPNPNPNPDAVAPGDGGASGACCDSTNVSKAVAKNRAIVLLCLETMRDWVDAAMRGNSPEQFQHARLLVDAMELILGTRPLSLQLPEPASPQTVATYVPEYAPLNPRLMDLYDITRDRMNMIHACMNASRLRNGHPRSDMPYFGTSPLREGWRTTENHCADETDWCYLRNPYRFFFRMQKAQETTAKVREFGALLLSAFEKGEAEHLAALRANHEREILDMQLTARQDQWRDADWQVEALQKTKAVSQANLAYFNSLIANGLNSDEIGYQDLTIASMILRAAGDVLEGIAGGVELIPNMFTGIAGFGGTPLFYVQLPVGQPLAGAFSIAARIMNGLSAIAGSTAGLDLTEAGWERRLQDWQHQVQILTIEIEQIELQILAAQRRRGGALQELNVHQRQREQSIEVQNFLRDKFTARDLYLFMQKEAADLYWKMFEPAWHWARLAQFAFNLERGHKTRRFLPECSWNSLQEGLMAGERLDVALRHMEKAYLDENVRVYELTKHISLREHFPLEYLRLRTTGYCEVKIPEWMFDQDYPGMYMRRIKSITLTIPCVTGPFNNVNCRLTLLSSVTRIDPRLDPPVHRCCCDRGCMSEYELCPCDPRAVRDYAAREAIATSSGKNDSGVFELKFEDERYLPFEYRGAACHLRAEMRHENNYFDPETVSDAILCVYYTAWEGGPLLARAASDCARKHLPGDGWCFFDVRHDFPDSWELLRMARGEEKRHKHLDVRLTRRMFPYVPCSPEVRVDRITLLFEARQDERQCCEVGECTCLEHKSRHSYEVGLAVKPECNGHEHELVKARCLASSDCPHLYVGDFDIAKAASIGEIATRFEFPREIEEISRIYLFCHYVREV